MIGHYRVEGKLREGGMRAVPREQRVVFGGHYQISPIRKREARRGVSREGGKGGLRGTTIWRCCRRGCPQKLFLH